MKRHLIALLLIASIGLTGCAYTSGGNQISQEAVDQIQNLLDVDADGNTAVNAGTLKQVLGSGGDAITAADQAGIRYMYEVEKLAKDVYAFLSETWGQQVFENITGSEATHQAAVADLAAAYGVSLDDLGSSAGVFTNPELQNLYTTLTTQGSASLEAAYGVGAAIEEIDIIDLEEYMNATDNADIVLVYENLQRGSRNHLRAFVRTMERSGNTYQAQYLENAQYQEIVSGSVEQGGTNQRSGKGSMNGSGGQGRGRK